MVKLKEKLRWTYFADMLEDAYKQCLLEGKSVGKYRADIDKVWEIKDETVREMQARALIGQMEREQVREEYPFDEPSEYEQIQESLASEHTYTEEIEETLIREKLMGAWIGRATGCLLGVPVETWTRERIEGFLRESGQYPLKDFMRGDVSEEIRQKYGVEMEDPQTPYDRKEICWRENVTAYPVDDDMNYPVLALKITERYGRAFTPEDAAEGWLLGMPGLHACTAERAAYRNLMQGILPPFSGRRENPYREWLGAQIRGDFWGYVNPGQPKRAAAMAYNDACISHDKNGIYAEMFVAAVCSLCYSRALSMREIIEYALMEIPGNTRLAQGIRTVLEETVRDCPFERIVDRIHREYDETNFFDWCYVLPNIQLITAVLLYYSDSFTDAVTQIVLCGFDTDCNGATVGSMAGLYRGIKGIDEKWYAGLEQTVHTSIHGYAECSIEELVERTCQCIAKETTV